jgi:hypothetical protein
MKSTRGLRPETPGPHSGGGPNAHQSAPSSRGEGVGGSTADRSPRGDATPVVPAARHEYAGSGGHEANSMPRTRRHQRALQPQQPPGGSFARLGATSCTSTNLAMGRHDHPSPRPPDRARRPLTTATCPDERTRSTGHPQGRRITLPNPTTQAARSATGSEDHSATVTKDRDLSWATCASLVAHLRALP